MTCANSTSTFIPEIIARSAVLIEEGILSLSFMSFQIGISGNGAILAFGIVSGYSTLASYFTCFVSFHFFSLNYFLSFTLIVLLLIKSSCFSDS